MVQAHPGTDFVYQQPGNIMYTCHLVSELQIQLDTPSLTLSWAKVSACCPPREDSFVHDLPDKIMYNLTVESVYDLTVHIISTNHSLG